MIVLIHPKLACMFTSNSGTHKSFPVGSTGSLSSVAVWNDKRGSKGSVIIY